MLVIVVDSFDVATIMKWIVNTIFQKTFPGFASSRPTRAIIVEKKRAVGKRRGFDFGLGESLSLCQRNNILV